MNKSDKIDELAKALHKAQSMIDNASKSKEGHGYKYADLAEILDITTPVFSECGLAQMQIPIMEDGKACLETVIMHTSGQWISGTALMAHAKLHKGNEAQMMGATIAYQRRYSLKSMVGIAEVDEEKNFKANETKTEQKKKTQDAIIEEAKAVLDKITDAKDIKPFYLALAPNIQSAMYKLCEAKGKELKPKTEVE